MRIKYARIQWMWITEKVAGINWVCGFIARISAFKIIGWIGVKIKIEDCFWGSNVFYWRTFHSLGFLVNTFFKPRFYVIQTCLVSSSLDLHHVGKWATCETFVNWVHVHALIQRLPHSFRALCVSSLAKSWAEKACLWEQLAAALGDAGLILYSIESVVKCMRL